MEEKKRYGVLLLGAFLLEAAGYIAFPFLALQLRSQFSLSEATIGTFLFIAVALRPIWAICGGFLAEHVRSVFLFVAACLAESFSFFALATANSPVIALAALILGNLGFSLWTPNLFGLIYRWYEGSAATRRVSILTGVLNAGAATGCLVGAILTATDVRQVFIGAGILYAIIVPVLAWILPLELERPAARDLGHNRFQWRKSILPIIAVSLTTFGFWASYGQFNSFFALFANDWLKNKAITGVAFGMVAVLVSLFSFFLSKYGADSSRLRSLSASTSILLGIGWFGMTADPQLATAFLFLVALSLGESVFSLYLAENWALLNRSRPGLMQSLNFAARNVSMGAGSFIGGLVYNSNQQLHLWGFANVACLMIVVATVGILNFWGRPQ